MKRTLKNNYKKRLGLYDDSKFCSIAGAPIWHSIRLSGQIYCKFYVQFCKHKNISLLATPQPPPLPFISNINKDDNIHKKIEDLKSNGRTNLMSRMLEQNCVNMLQITKIHDSNKDIITI